MSQAEAHNIRLISQHTLDGYGGLGEGMALRMKAHQRILPASTLLIRKIRK